MNERADADSSLIPEPVDLQAASPAFRRFYHVHFVDTILLLRNEVDLDFASRLTANELALARRLLRANLQVSVYRNSAALLNDREAIPILEQLVEQAKQLTEKIDIARALWILDRSPIYPSLIDRLVRGRNAALKQQHIYDILQLADRRAIDHLYTLAQDQDEAVRDLAIFHLTDLANAWKGRWLNNESTRTPDLEYFLQRRESSRFIKRMLKELREWHDARPLVS
ncbi:MAG: hypothetical protein WEE89_08870 [Gemmatimonadota bacterium]